MIRKEVAIFLIVGTLSVVIDFVMYKSLLWTGLAVNLAKGSGFITGTVFAYFANRAWTFGHVEKKPGSFLRFGLVYALTLCANILVNRIFLYAFEGFSQAVQLAFLVATGVSATLNFLGMKFYAFRAAVPREGEVS